MKIVINKCFGGFSLSEVAYQELGLEWDGYGFAFASDSERSNEALVACVEKLGDLASGLHAKLKVVEIPDDVVFEIQEYDGKEHIRECSRTWN